MHRYARAFMPLLALAAAAQGQAPTDPLQQLRLLEAKYPRIPYDSILVGTFDAATGTFSGQVSTTYPAARDCSPDFRGKTKCTTEKASATPPTVIARARQVGLIFKVLNNTAPFSVTVNGATATVPPGIGHVTVPVTGQPVAGDTSHALWTVSWRASSGGKSYRDSLIVDRMSFGVGTFTIPVLPIAIVYDPPQDSARDNVEIFSQSTTYGSSLTTSLTSSSSSTAAASTQWQPFADFYAGVKTAGEMTSAVPALAVVSQVLGAAATILPQIFGTASATEQKTTNTVKSSTHQLMLKTTDTYKTAQLGPGRGDQIVYYKNMRVVWLSRCCAPLALVPLGAEMAGANTIVELQSDLASLRSGHGAPHSRLDSLSIKGLLALDPFVAGGNGAVLSPERFDSIAPPIALSSVQRTESFTVSDFDLRRSGSATMTQTVATQDQGLLGSLELGDASGTVVMSFTHASLGEQSVEQSRTVDVLLGGRGLDTSIVNAYYDRVFGAVAVRIIPSGPDIVVGDLADSAQADAATSPQPLARTVAPRGARAGVSQAGLATRSLIAGRSVTLIVAGRTYRATTDERGHYVFRLPHNATAVEGTITLDRSAMTQRITLGGVAARVAVPPLRVR